MIDYYCKLNNPLQTFMEEGQAVTLPHIVANLVRFQAAGFGDLAQWQSIRLLTEGLQVQVLQSPDTGLFFFEEE